jgi:hypothetical protein
MIESMKRVLVIVLTSLALLSVLNTALANERNIKADIWADNWFAIYNETTLVKEDSVPYNTERSFNADSFVFTTKLPVQINIIVKDFKENDTGLEYIGRPRQQMGDGGFSAQFHDADSGELIAVSDETWRCKSIHRAPLNRSCEHSANPLQDCENEISVEPEGWMSAEFDDSDWPHAVVHTEAAVRPRRGYQEIEWNVGAKLLWAEDLVIDNTILCRVVLR